MIIRFLVDYRGVLTNEKFYEAGAVVELAKASVLVSDGRAVYVDKSPPSIPANHEPVKAVALGFILGGLNVQQLKGMAKTAGIKGYGRMRRGTLIKKLEENDAVN
jgi:hypothetical protein